MRAWRIAIGAILPLAVRHLVTHRVAASVALIAMTCGVASMVATQLMYESVVVSYESTVRRFAGRAALQVANGGSGVPEELAEELSREPGVRAVAASVEDLVAVPDFPGEQLYLYGIDLLADHHVRDYGSTSGAVLSDPLVFLAEPDSVALTTAFMRAHGLRLHDRIRILAPAGAVTLTIRAALGTQRGPASALDGRVAIVDLSVAQGLLQSGRRVSHLAIELTPEADLATVERALGRVVGGRGVVERPTSRAAAFARLLTNYRYGLLLAASTAMVVALYFVFNVATIAVVERRQELGLLRAIGLGRWGVLVLVVVELLALSVAASIVALPFGVGLARALAGVVGSSVAALYVDVGVPTPALHWRPAFLGVGLGMLAPVLAAAGPIRHVLALTPLEVVRPSGGTDRQTGSYAGAAAFGAALLGGAMATWACRTMLPISLEAAGILTMLAGVVALACIAPMAVHGLAGIADALARRFLGAVAMLATRSLMSEIGRVAITCSAVLVGLAGTIAIAAWLASLDRTLNAAFETVFAKVDLLVSAGADPFAVDATRISDAVAAEIASMRQVAYVDPVRINTMAFAGSLISVVAGDANLYARGQRTLQMIEGDSATAGRALVSGSAVVVNSTFVSRFHRGKGDMLDLVTPAGALRVRIAGIYLELAPGDLATMHLDRALYRRWWRDDTASLLAVSLRDGVDRQHVTDLIRARWGDRRLVVLTLEQMRREYQAMLRHLAALVEPLVGFAVLVALVGIVSARAASMMARVRSSGILRVVGATRRQLARLFMIEAAIVGTIAATFAAVAGSVLARMQVDILLRGMLGMSILFAYPSEIALLGGLAVVGLTTGAGWVLGLRAGGFSVSEALRWE